jgi:predicted PurR-regulated permease PerM
VLESASHVYDIREHETIRRPFTLHCRHKAAVAGVAVVLVAVAVVGPTQLVTQQLVWQVATGVNWFQSEGAAEHWRSALARHPRLAFGLAWIAEPTDLRGAIGRASSALTAGASTVVAGSVGAVAQLLVTFFALFYFFRDQRPALGALRALVPLSEPEAEAVFARVTDTIYGTVFGTLGGDGREQAGGSRRLGAGPRQAGPERGWDGSCAGRSAPVAGSVSDRGILRRA